MLGIKRIDKISNKEIYEKVQIDPLVTQVQKRQLRYVGHCIRKPKEELIHQYVLYEPGHGKRSKGKPKESYCHYIGTLIGGKEPWSAKQIRDEAAKKTEWRKLVRNCVPMIAADL